MQTNLGLCEALAHSCHHLRDVLLIESAHFNADRINSSAVRIVKEVAAVVAHLRVRRTQIHEFTT